MRCGNEIDIIENSYGSDYIRLSEAKAQALSEMIKTNNRLIYSAPMIKRYESNTNNVVEGLFERLYNQVKDIDYSDNKTLMRIKKHDNKIQLKLIDFILDKNYDSQDLPEQIVVDYIAGMTDGYALKTFEDMYWI